MLNRFPRSLCDPELTEWESLFQSNQTCLEALPPRILELREALRKRVKNKLNLTHDALVLTGHQPVCHHLGTLFKTALLNEASHRMQVGALNVSIDLDYGSFEFPFPTSSGTGLGLEYSRITTGSGLFVRSRLLGAKELDTQFNGIAGELTKLGLNSAAKRTLETVKFLRQFENRPVSEVGTALRRKLDHADLYQELTLSDLVGLPEIVSFFSILLRDFKDVVQIYNSTLDEYRKRRRIENLANPFPNLKVAATRSELPFWIVDLNTGKRSPLFMQKLGKEFVFLAESQQLCALSEETLMEYPQQLGPGVVLVPRALLISLTLRLLLADLFVHGKGGIRYDRCTDDFIRNYFKITPPTSVTASATEYLFQAQVDRFEELAKLTKDRREIYFHLRRFLDADWLSGHSHGLLPLLERHEALTEKLKHCQSQKLSTKELTQEKKKLDLSIRLLVDNALDNYLAATLAPAQGNREFYYFREFPAFFFLDL